MTKLIFTTFGIGIGITLLIALAVLMPILYIWALNTLFNLTIPFSLETWSAAVLLQMFFHNTINLKYKKEE